MSDAPTLVIQGRVSPQDIALATEYLAKNGYKPQSRSDLVGLCFKLVCELAKMQGHTAPATNHLAFEQLLKYGIEWPVKTYQRDLMKALAWDSIGEMDMEGLLETHGRALQATQVAGQPAATTERKPITYVDEETGEEKEYDFLAELEAIDREIKEKEKSGP